MYLKPGEIINERYEIMNQLGSGGFGNTYLVKDIQDSNSKLVVVKEIIPKANTKLVLQRVIKRFKREVKALKKLGKHPNIPCFFETFIQENKLYLVQEYIEGHDLSEEFNQSLSESEVIKLLKDVLEILRFVHQNRVIHRDIKPSNLMRRQSDQQIMLIDFGAVKEISSMEDNEESPQARTIAIGTTIPIAPP